MADGRPIDDYQLQQALDTVIKCEGDKPKAAKILNIPYSTLVARHKIAIRRGMIPQAGIADEKQYLKLEVQKFKDRVNALEVELKSLRREKLTEDSVRQHIFQLVSQPHTTPKWATNAAIKDSKFNGIPSIMLSDLHWGEVVEPTQINGINRYNLATAQRRLRTFVDRVCDFCFNHMTNARYPGIIVNLGGDMISGDIHDELMQTNQKPIGPVFINLYANIIAALEVLASKFNNVWVLGVAGNHGRMSVKPKYKERAYSNFDWLLYQKLKVHFAKDKRLTFWIPDGTDAYYQVYNHRYLLTHGDNLGTRGGDGIIGLLGPVIRGDTKIRAANSAIGMPYDTLLMGHWHNYLAIRRVIINGSLKGFDEYAHLHLRAMPEPPIQALWFTHPKHGMTIQVPIFCDEGENKNYIGPVVQPLGATAFETSL